MRFNSQTVARSVVAPSAIVVALLCSLVRAEPAPAPAAAPPAARQAIEARKAAFTLIGANFRPIGEVLQGKAPYDAAEVQKRAARVAFLSTLLDDAFPEISQAGDTKSKPEVWSNRADFDQRLKQFQEHARALAEVAQKDSSGSDAFKTAAAAVGKDCKTCHEEYKLK